MPKKISSRKSSVVIPPVYEAPVLPERKRAFSWRWVFVALAVIAGMLFAVTKGWVVAALVEGRPIFSWQLNSTLRSRYGQQTLEGMIGEALIASQARKSGIRISASDIDEKQKEILSSMGTDVKLDDFLKFQGMSKQDFEQQLKIQLTVEKLLTKDLVISEADIDNYIATSRALLVATEPAALRAEAKRSIIGNTVSQKLQAWFLEVRQKASVMKFL